MADTPLIDFGAPLAAETALKVPARVVSNDLANQFSSAIVVLPLTSNIENVRSFQLFLPRQRSGLDRDSKVQVELIRHVGRGRVKRVLGQVPADLMDALDRLLAEHLGLLDHS